MDIMIEKGCQPVKFNHHWKFCVGAPHALFGLRHDFTTQLSMVHRDLGIERVRFHGIFDDDMHTIIRANETLAMPFGGSYTEKSFRQCAAVYDNVLEAGMKPWVELSFMPKHLAKKRLFRTGTFFYKPIVCLPRKMKQWQEYVQSFVTFLINRYGKEEVESWFFEVWNEPDIPWVFFFGKQEDYFRLYTATAEAVKSVDPDLKVGGPSTSGSRWIGEFLEYCKSTGSPLDFISTHQYAGDPIAGLSHTESGVELKLDFFAGFKKRKELSHDNILDLYRAFIGTKDAVKGLQKDAFTESAEHIRALIGDLPLYYTEWNMSASFTAPQNDTSMQACYDLQTIFRSQKTVTGSSIWMFSDLFEEQHQFPEEFHGGFGMMTQSGIKKPTYHALQFLNEAGDDVLGIFSEGRVDAAVFQKDGEFHIIASSLDFEEKEHTDTVMVRIPADREMTAFVTGIGKDSANPLKEWQALGSPQVPTVAEIRSIRESSVPVTEKTASEYDGEWITLRFSIGTNEIKRIILR